MQVIDKLKNHWNGIKSYPYKKKTKQIIFETPAEIFIGAGLLASTFGVASYSHENAKRGKIPLAFSEIGENRHRFNWRGLEVPPLTNFYSVTNDVAMMTFEGNNLGYAWNEWSDFWDSTDRIAYELEKKIEPTMRVHHLISDYAPEYPKLADKALNSLNKLVKAEPDLPEVIQALDDAWDEEHHDQYRTEVYFENVCTTSTGANGQSTTSCTPQMRTRQVYDHTDHYYTYHKEAGARAAALLKDFIEKHPDIRIEEKLYPVNVTNAENEWAMRESRRKQRGASNMKSDEYLPLANTWANGSNFSVYLPKAYANHAGVVSATPAWDKARKTAQSESYQTYSHQDDGPQEFQIAEAALNYAVSMSRNSHAITDGIRTAGVQVPLLNKKIGEYVNAALHKGPGNPEKLRSEVMILAQNIYKKNFAGGFDTEPAKWGMVVLWTVLGGLLGGGLGYGADRLIDRKYGRGSSGQDQTVGGQNLKYRRRKDIFMKKDL